MDTKTLDLLDFYRVREHIAGLCASEDGKNRLLAREPLTDSDAIAHVKSLGKSMYHWLKSARFSFFASWEPVDSALMAVKTEGAAFSLLDALSLLRITRTASGLKTSYAKYTEKEISPNALDALIKTIPPLDQGTALISKVITDSGELRETPELKSIREKISSLKTSIEVSLKHCIENAKKDDVLQSAIPVLRGARQLVAVKAGAKTKVRGIVHEVSQSGQTFFVEPGDVVQKNNDLVESEFFLERETRRILRCLASSLRPFYAEFETAREVLTEIDCALACAKWAAETNGIFAAVALPPALFQARHPRLGAKAVPVDIAFEDNKRVIVITGPNTGGKTVAIKTFALFAALNQCGFPIPAAEDIPPACTRLPVFSRIFADIGDEQSIDNSLSTFSSHMARVREILLSADSGSLVLLDELGAGTDPEEGSALAMAILDELIARGAYVLVTSHHGALKNYAFTHAHCINASVEFDSQNLIPAYRVIQGVPGKSAAIEIAHNSGIPQAVLERAKTYLKDGHADMSLLIQELTNKNELARRLTENLRAQSEELNKDAQKIALRETRIKQRELEISELALQRKKDFADESRKLLENLVRELREGEITREKTLAVKQFISELDKQNALDSETLAAQKAELTETDGMERDAQSARDEDSFEPREGEPVWILSLKREGRVVQKSLKKKDGGSKAAWITQVGSVRLSIAQSDMKPIAHNARRGTEAFFSDGAPSFTGESPQYELRVLGMRQEEALKALQRQIDLASMSAFSQFCVIHGKGNGVLQKAVHEYLSRESRVGEFYFARPEDGGTGKTYIRLV